MDFNNVNVLSISQNNIKYDSDLTFSVQKNIQITGFLIDLTNDNGVKKIFQEASDIIEIPSDTATSDASITNALQDITVNNINYGEGFVETFSVQGEQIQTALYSASIIISESGDINKIILSQNGTAGTPTNTELNLNKSSITENDLKYLESFEESFDFRYQGENNISVSHKISTKFKNRKSLISNRKNIWSNSSIQQSKLSLLKNKGKKSIKVSAGQSASYSINLEPESYILFFDYVGQNSQNYGNCSVDFGSESISLNNSPGRKSVELEISELSTIPISLNANSSNDTFFDNFKLYKKSETPLQKSRDFANFLYNNNPNYGILEGNQQGIYTTQEFFDNFSTKESFDQINLNYSIEKIIEHSALGADNEYSFLGNLSFIYDDLGVVSVTESGKVKVLKNKNSANLKSHIESVLSNSHSRCSNFFSSFKGGIDYGCPTPTETQTGINDLFSNPVVKSINYNFEAGTADVLVTFSNDETYKETTKKYKHESSASVNDLEGFYEITLNGIITGDGDNTDEKNSAAKQGLVDATNSALSVVNETKQNFDASSTFYLVSKNIQTDKFNGSINYNFVFSNKESFDQESLETIKSYEIDVNISNPADIVNQFSINCIDVGQKLKNLKTFKRISTRINVSGFHGVTQSTLYTAAKSILRSKNLLLAEDSENESANFVENSNENEFLVSQSYSYSTNENTLVYSRIVIDLSTCPVETSTRTIDENFGWDNLFYDTPGPEPTLTEYSYVAPTFTIYDINQTRTPDVDYDFFTPTITKTTTPPPTLTETPTPTTTQTETIFPTVTVTIFPTLTQTETETQTIINYYELEVSAPDNWNNNIANLLPDGNIISGKRCLDQGGNINNFSTVFINNSYASNASNIVKDCFAGQGDNGAAFHSFTFNYPEHLPTPSVQNSYCNFYSVEIPSFYDGTIAGLISSNNYNFIGYYNSGDFIYNNQIDQSQNLANDQYYNSSHPNFQNNVLAITGPLIFESCVSLEPFVEEYIQIDIPNNSSDSLGDLIISNITNYVAGNCYEIIGYFDCFDIQRFNETIQTPTHTATVIAKNYMIDEIIDNCNELSSRRQLNHIYLRKYSCSATTIQEAISQ